LCLQGALLPHGISSKHRRRRKVSIEVHRVQNVTGIELEVECIVRFFDPISDEERRAAEMRAKTKLLRHLQDEAAAASVLSTAGDGDDKSPTAARVPTAQYLDATSTTPYVLANYDKGWKTKYIFPLKDITIIGTHMTGVLLLIEMNTTELRELVFDSQEEAEEFELALKIEHAKELLKRNQISSAPEAAAPGQLEVSASVANRSTTTLLSAKIFECYSPQLTVSMVLFLCECSILVCQLIFLFMPAGRTHTIWNK